MDATNPWPGARAHTRPPSWLNLYLQVLIASRGVVLGILSRCRKAMKRAWHGFIALIRMMIAPLIFCTVVHGIASMSDLRRSAESREDAVVFRSGFDFRAALGLIVASWRIPAAASTSTPPRSIQKPFPPM